MSTDFHPLPLAEREVRLGGMVERGSIKPQPNGISILFEHDTRVVE